jgi:hypothetical protein
MCVVATIVAFAFLNVINGWFATIDHKQSLKLSVFGAVRICVALSKFLNHLNTVVRLTGRMNVVLVALFITEYVSCRRLAYDLCATFHRLFGPLRCTAPGVSQN